MVWALCVYGRGKKCRCCGGGRKEVKELEKGGEGEKGETEKRREVVMGSVQMGVGGR